jgi:hypothetical protein
VETKEPKLENQSTFDDVFSRADWHQRKKLMRNKLAATSTPAMGDQHLYFKHVSLKDGLRSMDEHGVKV